MAHKNLRDAMEQAAKDIVGERVDACLRAGSRALEEIVERRVRQELRRLVQEEVAWLVRHDQDTRRVLMEETISMSEEAIDHLVGGPTPKRAAGIRDFIQSIKDAVVDQLMDELEESSGQEETSDKVG